jgi:hypothetical protein
MPSSGLLGGREVEFIVQILTTNRRDISLFTKFIINIRKKEKYLKIV